jgi:hypothetical protein
MKSVRLVDFRILFSKTKFIVDDNFTILVLKLGGSRAMYMTLGGLVPIHASDLRLKLGVQPHLLGDQAHY